MVAPVVRRILAPSGNALGVDDHVAFLKSLFANRPGFEQGTRRLLSHCRNVEPNATWERMESLDFQRDAANFGAWISRNLPAEQLGSGSLRAFHFGLSEDGGSIQIDGTAEYDETGVENSWVCNSVFRSAEDWTDSTVLSSIQMISEECDGAVPILLYMLCVGYVGLLIQHWIPHAFWPAAGRKAPVAVGFLDGDSYLVHSSSPIRTCAARVPPGPL